MTKRVLLCGVAMGTLFASAANAGTLFMAQLKGSNEPPPTVGSAATGTGFLILNDAQTSATVTLTHNEATVNPSPVTLGHIHRGPAGVAGPVIFPFPNPNSPVGPLTWTGIAAADITNLFNGGLYMNIHTQQNPGGDIRGQLIQMKFANAAVNDMEGSLGVALTTSAGLDADLDAVLKQQAQASAATQTAMLDEESGRSIYVQSREGIETMASFSNTLLSYGQASRLGASNQMGLDIFATAGADFATRETVAGETGSQVSRPWVMGGAAYNFGTALIGAGVGYAQGTETLHNNMGQTKGKTVALEGFASLGMGASGLVADVALGYGWNNFNNSRNLPDFTRTAVSSPKGSTVSAALKLSRPIQLQPNMVASPYAQIDYQKASIDPYTETGAASLSLVVPKQDVSNANGEIGAQVAMMNPEPWGVLSPRLQVGWRHVMDNGKTTLTTRLTGSAVSFTTPLLAAKDAAHVGVGLAAQMTNGMEFSLGYSGLIGSSRMTTHSLGARFTIRR